jgi:hypothetical protein
MASATFVLKKPNSKDNTLVYLLFRYQNQTFKYSTVGTAKQWLAKCVKPAACTPSGTPQ